MSAESLCGAPHPELLKSTAAIDRRQTLITLATAPNAASRASLGTLSLAGGVSTVLKSAD
jgi:hypothetical protein